MPGFNSKPAIGCLVANLVGGDYGPVYQAEVERYLRCNGRVWTANRLKAIWNAALHLKNGDPEKAIRLYQKESISYHKDGTPKGPLRRAVASFVDATRPIALRRWASLLRFYTGIRVETANRKQLQKIRDSITAPGPEVHPFIEDKFLWEFRWFLERKPGPKPGTTWARSASWESQFGQSLKGTSRYYSPVPLPRELQGRYYGSMVHSLLTTHVVPKSLRSSILGWGPITSENLDRLAPSDEAIGKVFFVMEGGAKVRCVAMPNAWVQLAFRPLHSILSQLQECFPESCVTDQGKGVYEALSQMKSGKYLYSLDLSSATDRLPRKLQTGLLRELGLTDFAEALDEVATQDWVFPDGSRVSYTVGQPMGLYGSFPLLNITNCLIGRLACRRCGIHGGFEHQFRVVGDDIIFFNREPAESYRSIMECLGVEISPLKTFEGKVGQFAGFILLPAKGGEYAFRPYKHPAGTQVTNVIQFLQSLGSRVTKISRKWEGIFSVYQRTQSFRDLSGEPIPWLVGENDPEPGLEAVDDRWLHSLVNGMVYCNPGLYDQMVEWAYQFNPGDRDKPLFHEQRMTRILGHGPDFETNARMERESFRVDLDLWSDPLVRDSLQREGFSVRQHERIYVGSDGTRHVTKVRAHARHRHSR